MTDVTGSNPFLDAFFQVARSWSSLAAPPQWLNQPILPGWSLISVNETNSASPDTERAVVATASYGRQLGRLMDAVETLIEERPANLGAKDAFTDLQALAGQIEQAKAEAAKTDFARQLDALRRLKTRKPDEFARQKAALLAILGDG